MLFRSEGERAAARYNAAFFVNGAEPGGVIQAEGDRTLSDDEFTQLMHRWNDSHRGTSNAHRVGFLENGKFVPRSYSRKDMEFIDLRNFSKDTIREAWRFPKSKLGSESASNRATWEAAQVQWGTDILEPRLRRIRTSLNDDFLARFPSDLDRKSVV